MPVLDFETGKETGEKLEFPQAQESQNNTQVVNKGVLDLKTGLPVAQKIEQPKVEEKPEELPDYLQSRSIADLASDVAGAPTGQMLGDFLGKVSSGYEMLARLPFQGLDKAIEEGQKTEQTTSEFFAPKTDLGKKSTESVFNALSKLELIPAGWGGIAELIETQDPDKASQTVEQVKEKGLQKHLADLNFEAYGSPVLAAATESSAAIAALLFQGSKSLHQRNVDQARKDIELIEQMESGTAGKNLVNYKLQNRNEWSRPSRAEVEVLTEKLKSDPVFAKEYAEQMPRVTKKSSGKLAVNQEWDKGLLGLIQASSKKDIEVMERQLDIYNKARDNIKLKSDNRPIYEAGKAVEKTVKDLLKEKNDAGKRVGAAAENLRGVDVDYAPAVDKFVNSLLEDSVVINNGRPITNIRQYRNIDFRNSPYDGSRASQNLIRNQIKTLTEKDFALDGFNIHTTIKSLPYQIETAKGKKDSGGLVSKAESHLSQLRRDLNEVLKNSSDEYRQAKGDFSSIATVFDGFNESVDKKSRIDWKGVNPDNAGKALRSILSNNTNASNLNKALANMSSKAKELGYKYNEDAVNQAFFAIGLDRRLGAFADQSLQGITEQGGRIADIPTGAIDATVKTLGSAMRKIKRVDDDRAIDSMRKYLKESKEGKN